MPRTTGLHPNLAAFLDTIAYSEIGSKLLASSDDGYDVVVGSTVAAPHLVQRTPNNTPDYHDHPNIVVKLSPTLLSTAFGRYQILYRFWVAYKRRLNLPDISPLSQDRYALQILREQKATPLILANQIEAAIHTVSCIWASLPGPDNTYGQHVNNIETLLAAYKTYKDKYK